MGHIGDNPQEIELEPLEAPATTPAPITTPAPAPVEPVPA